jgi:DnaJ-class molecular chaperone
MSRKSFRPFGADSVAVLAGSENGQDASCFADEVAIDFPSMAPAVDRIRSAFLAGERSTPLSTAIRLSYREALAGATLPLEVPVRCTCRRCGGRGESWTERCDSCDGSGAQLLSHHLRVNLPAGVLDGALFRFTVTPRHHPTTRIELRILVG